MLDVTKHKIANVLICFSHIYSVESGMVGKRCRSSACSGILYETVAHAEAVAAAGKRGLLCRGPELAETERSCQLEQCRQLFLLLCLRLLSISPSPTAASSQRAAAAAGRKARPSRSRPAAPSSVRSRGAAALRAASPRVAAAAAVVGGEAMGQSEDASARQAQPSPSAPSPSPQGQPTVAQLAAHGPLYDFISFSNVPQWVGMCSLAFNAYRVASEKGDRARQTQAVIDLLMLPQRTLTRLPRGAGSKRAARRQVNTIKARCRDVGAELRRCTGCVDPPDRTVQLTVHSAPLITPATAATGQRSAAAAAVSSSSVADTESDSDDSDDSDDGEPVRLAPGTPAADSDDEAETGSAPAAVYVPKAPGPVSDRHHRMARASVSALTTRQLARRIVSSLTDTRIALLRRCTPPPAMADLTQPAVREAVQLLHPPLPADSVVPRLPADAEQLILEDGEDMQARHPQQRQRQRCSAPLAGRAACWPRWSSPTSVASASSRCCRTS